MPITGSMKQALSGPIHMRTTYPSLSKSGAATTSCYVAAATRVSSIL